MARLLFIVARDQPGLLEFLRRDFAAEEAQGDIEIFMDRRESPRGQAVQPRGAEGVTGIATGPSARVFVSWAVPSSLGPPRSRRGATARNKGGLSCLCTSTTAITADVRLQSRYRSVSMTKAWPPARSAAATPFARW